MPLHAMATAATSLPLEIFEKGLEHPIVKFSVAIVVCWFAGAFFFFFMLTLTIAPQSLCGTSKNLHSKRRGGGRPTHPATHPTGPPPPFKRSAEDDTQSRLSYNMHVWPWSVAMSDSSSILVRGTLYIVFCSFIVKNTHWTKGWKCLWWGHSVNQNRPLLS